MLLWRERFTVSFSPELAHLNSGFYFSFVATTNTNTMYVHGTTHTQTHTPKERSSEWQTRLVSLLETHKMYHPWAQRIHHIALAQHRTLAHAHIYIHLYLYMQKIEYFLYFTPKNSRKNVHFSVLLLARWLARSLYVQANKCYFHLYRLLSTDLVTSPFVWFCHFFGS